MRRGSWGSRGVGSSGPGPSPSPLPLGPSWSRPSSLARAFQARSAAPSSLDLAACPERADRVSLLGELDLPLIPGEIPGDGQADLIRGLGGRDGRDPGVAERTGQTGDRAPVLAAVEALDRAADAALRGLARAGAALLLAVARGPPAFAVVIGTLAVANQRYPGTEPETPAWSLPGVVRWRLALGKVGAQPTPHAAPASGTGRRPRAARARASRTRACAPRTACADHTRRTRRTGGSRLPRGAR